ncbi:MAG: cytidine deaminase [Bacteroidaceae bacterium]|nr:cytidine deaminase [Bacteroidaceae bacterium]
METLAFHIPYVRLDNSELSEADSQLIEAAKAATQHSYAPYSKFRVGAAVLLSNGEVVSGSNQENAATPNGICAERCAVFYANARYPEDAVTAIAIAARDTTGTFTQRPISPCGMCRQVLSETEYRHQVPMRILLYGTAGTFLIEGVKSLLPFSFDESFL